MHSPKTFPVPLIRVEETDSTNRYLSDLCHKRCVGELTTVSAHYQTSGKGQRGNSWESEAGKNLMFSLVLYPSFLEARRQFILSQLISLSIKEELDTYTPDISIKWPNDIYWKDKKICGILIENDLTGTRIGRSIAGIGININQEKFLSPAPNPVSLKQITGQSYDCSLLLERIMTRVREYYTLLQTNEADAVTNISDRYARSLFRKEGFHPYVDDNGEFLARLVCVEPDGRLILEDQTGTKRAYLFKEVQYVLPALP
ncbi:biotin--[acetyl-CoA-carboxylase] ligase [Bacteroides sp.]